jgi:hypothetical protein
MRWMPGKDLWHVKMDPAQVWFIEKPFAGSTLCERVREVLA